MFKKIIIFSFCAFLLATESNLDDNSLQITSNSFDATILDNQIQFGYSYSTGWSTGPFWIGIHCHNIDDIAGFQFELPDNLQLLDANGGRAEEVFSDLHHNKKGMILGFSMSANKIQKIDEGTDDLLLKIQVKATSGTDLNFPIKAILAGSSGQKLSFEKTSSELEIKSDTGETQLIKVSFYE
jgi:hypothetical protein|tara:strand:+ start:1920 stop:2468 length:549 start_codon:yes stop_codon:yes gene_type:complete